MPLTGSGSSGARLIVGSSQPTGGTVKRNLAHRCVQERFSAIRPRSAKKVKFVDLEHEPLCNAFVDLSNRVMIDGMEASENTEVSFTRAEAIEAIREVYRGWCEMTAREEGIEKIRLPDYETMLDQLEKHGLPSPSGFHQKDPTSRD